MSAHTGPALPQGNLRQSFGSPLSDNVLRFINPTLPPWHEVEALYKSAYRTGFITNGPLVKRFEDEVAERLGVRHCVAVSSCTSGLILTMKALGLEGEVIMPSFTFFATGMAAKWAGLTPVLADCDESTWNISVSDVERRITPSTAAIIGVHMYGNPCDVEGLKALSERHGCRLIFDAAHAFGSVHFNQQVGGFGDAEVFSLSPTKLLIAGEGGLVTTNDPILARRLVAARNYGDVGRYDPELQGLNARMSEFNAALGIAGLRLVNPKINRHNAIASLYTELLRDLPGVFFQEIRPTDQCTYKDYSILIDPQLAPCDRDAVAAGLLESGFETKKYFYPPLHQQRIFRDLHGPDSLPLTVTEKVAGGILSLPVYHTLKEGTIRAICSAIRHRFAAAVRAGARQ